jgi:hypothetical protein
MAGTNDIYNPLFHATTWDTVFIEKLKVAELVKKYGNQNPFLCSESPATENYPQRVEANLHPLQPISKK